MARTLVAHLPGSNPDGSFTFAQTRSCVPWKKIMAADLGKFRVIFFYSKNGILCVLIRIA